MQGTRYTVMVHFHGTMAANAQGQFVTPYAATLNEVSFNSSNNSDAVLTIGLDDDTDAILVAAEAGHPAAPQVLRHMDFDGVRGPQRAVDYPRVQHGELVRWSIDFDGAAGTAAQNLSLMFTFTEG